MLFGDGFPDQLGDIDDQVGPAWPETSGYRTLAASLGEEERLLPAVVKADRPAFG